MDISKKLTGHAIIDPAENFWQTLDDQKFACGMFIVLEKAFHFFSSKAVTNYVLYELLTLRMKDV